MLIVFTILSCKKNPGIGGKSSIQGTVYYKLTDHNGKIISKELAKNERIYITYGDNGFYDDDIRTDFNGTYKFTYLRKGNYTISAYEDCSNCESGLNQVSVTVELKNNKENIVADNIELTKYVDIQDGFATVKGKVITNEYNLMGQLLGTYPSQDVRVYIRYDTDSVYFDDMRTDANGTYQFENLIIGNYTIYAYSDCINCGITGKEIKSVNVVVSEKDEIVTADDLYIEKYN